MSLDVHLMVEVTEIKSIFNWNITSNLGAMAQAAGIYHYLWEPKKMGVTKAQQLIEPLTNGLIRLKEDPEKYKLLNPKNGWGKYENLVSFVEIYLERCVAYPHADVEANA